MSRAAELAEQLARAELLVRVWARRLGVDRWELELHLDDPAGWASLHKPEDTDASVHRSRDYDTATFWLDPGWREWPARKLEATIVHELLHLATRDMEHVLDLLDGMVHRDVENVIAEAYRHAVEGAIDRLSYRLVDLVDELTPGTRDAL